MPDTLPDDLVAADELPDDLVAADELEPKKYQHAIPFLGNVAEYANIPGKYVGAWLGGVTPEEASESLIPGVTPESVPPILPVYPGGPPTEGIPGGLYRGALKTGLGLGQYLTSPHGVAEIAGARFLSPTAMTYKWMLDMAVGGSDAARDAWRKVKEGDWAGAAESAVQAGAMGLGLRQMYHGLRTPAEPGTPGTTPGTVEAPVPAGPPPISMGVRTVPNLAAIKEPTFAPSGLELGGPTPPEPLRQVPSPIEPEPLPGLPAAEPPPIPMRPAAPWELQRVRAETTPLRETPELPPREPRLETEKLKMAELPEDAEFVQPADVTMGVRTTVPEAPIGEPTFEPSGLGRPLKPKEPNARSIEKAAEIHGNVRPQPVEGAGEVPVEKGGPGVQPPEGGRKEGQAPREVLLKFEETAKNPEINQTTEDAYAAGLKVESVADLERLATLKSELSKAGLESKHPGVLKKGQLAREAIEAATNSGSAVEGSGYTPLKLGDRPLDWRKNPEVAKWLEENGDKYGLNTGEMRFEEVSKMDPGDYFTNAEKWAKDSMAEKGLGPARRAEQAATQFPDTEAWREAYMDAADEAQRIRDEIKADPKTMMARQKEMMGAAQKRTFFQEGLKVLEPEGAVHARDVAAESARIAGEAPKAEAPKTEPQIGEQLLGPFGIPDPAAVARATRKIIDEFASTKGAFQLRKLAEKLRGQRELIGRLLQTGATRQGIIASRDAADNTANLFARQMANEIRAPMHAEFGTPLTQLAGQALTGDIKGAYTKLKKPDVASDALSFVVEAQRNPAKLDAFEAQIRESTKADPYWKKRALDAIDFARNNWDRLLPHAERYKQITDAQVGIENSGGVDTLRRDGYVPHRQDVIDAFGIGGGTGEAAGFRKIREFNTFADSIAAGVDPKSINALELLESRIRSGQSMVNRRSWVEGFKNRVDPKTGQSIAVQPIVRKRADGSTYNEAPEGYSMETLNGEPVAVHNGYEGLITGLTDPSMFMKSHAGQIFMKTLGFTKSVKLLLDSFHLMRVGFWNAALRAASISDFQIPKGWSYKHGLTLLDYTPQAIRDMASRGEIPQDWLPSLLEDKARLDELVKQGFNVGKISDSMYQDWIHNILGIGHFNKFLFDQFQRGAMSEIGLMEFGRLKNARPEMTDAQIARQVARDLNTRFGNLGRQGWFKSKNFQDIARIIALAPQWNEGLIRSEFFGAGQIAKAGIELAQGKKLYMGTLGRALTTMVIGQFVANQLINMYTRGHPTWDNPEEGIGAKLSAWIPNPTWLGGNKDAPGFFLHPMGLAAETAHLLMQWYERTGNVRDSLVNYARSRASTVTSPILTGITNTDFLGRKLKPGTVWGQIVKDVIPRPIPTETVYGIAKSLKTKESRQQYQGQFQKQLMASFGIKSENAPSPVARIGKLAKEYNEAHGVEPHAEFYVGDFTPVTSLLAIGNETDAKEELDELMNKKTPREIVDHFQRWVRHPFTANKRFEGNFYQSLTDEQKRQYKLAVERRVELARKAITLTVQLNQERQKKQKEQAK